MKLKRNICVLLCFSLLLVLTACGTITNNIKIETSKPVENNIDLVLIPDENNTGNDTELVLIDDNGSESTGTEENDKPTEKVLLDAIEVNFIDVGQGDSTFIVTSNKDTILIDAGDSKNAAEIIECMDGYDFEDIDLMILTHPDADHINGAKTIIEKYPIKEIVMCSFVKDTKVFNGILDALEMRPEIKVTQGQLGLIWDIDDVHFVIVGVDSVVNKNGELSTANNSSVVTKMTYGEVSIMFMGDAEKEAEEVILQNGYDLSAQILKAGHHGSRTSSSVGMLEAINPKIAIISCGIDNKYGHPHEETLKKYDEMGIKYYRTDEQGTIKLEIDGVNITTVLNDTFSVGNMTSSRNFLFTPEVASVEIAAESDVLEAIESTEHK